MPSSPINIGKRAPFLLFLLPFSLGIVLGWKWELTSYFDPVLSLILFLAGFGCVVFYSHFVAKKGNKTTYLQIPILLFCFGILLSWWHQDSLRADYVGNYLKDSSFLKVRLESDLMEKTHSWKAKAEIVGVKYNEQVQSVRGKAFLYFQKKEKKPKLTYGDELILPQKLQKIKNAGNPGEFDYQRYCRIKNIAFTSYLRPEDWIRVKRKAGNPLLAFFIETRKKYIHILDKYVLFPRESHVAAALLLGYREDLDPELVQAFSNVGVVHLIAISGLHVGLIYLVLLWIFKWIPFKSKKLQGGVICISLWAFALLTGAHASTLRAAVMLSFLIFGKFFYNRDTHSLNILAASAFLLLCVNPFLLFDVGFQLSYLAVGGILIFQKPIENLLWVKNKMLHYCWKMMSVSFSAQLLVFPLVLYYFHQFPTVFLLSNLILIPVATFALYGEVLLLFSAILPFVAKGVGFLVTYLLFFMDESVLWVNKFSFIHWEYTHLTILKLVLLYLLIALFCSWLFYAYKKAAIWGACVLSFLFMIGLWDDFRIRNRQVLLIYNIPQKTAIEKITANQSQLYLRNLEDIPVDLRRYTLQPAKEALRIEHRKRVTNWDSFFKIGKFRLVVLDEHFPKEKIKEELVIDYVIVTNTNHLSMRNIQTFFQPQWVVFDASVYNWQTEKWKSACKKLNLHCFSVARQGAWRLSSK